MRAAGPLKVGITTPRPRWTGALERDGQRLLKPPLFPLKPIEARFPNH